MTTTTPEQIIECATKKLKASPTHHVAFSAPYYEWDDDDTTPKRKTKMCYCAIGAVNSCLTGSEDGGTTNTSVHDPVGAKVIERLYDALPPTRRRAVRPDLTGKSWAIQDYNDASEKSTILSLFRRAAKGA